MTPLLRIAYLLFIVIAHSLAIPTSLQAQDSLSAKESFEIRQPTDEVINAYKNDSKYQYGEVRASADSLFWNIVNWIWSQIRRLLSNPTVRDILEIIFYVTIGIVVIALINQFLKGNISSAFSRTSSKKSIALDFTEKHIDEVDLDKLLKEAIANKSYEKAVALLYHKALQQLSQTELITWKADKTNHDYLYELASHPSRSSFSDLMHYYEYVEYGDFSIREDDFSKIHSTYNSFNSNLE